VISSPSAPRCSLHGRNRETTLDEVIDGRRIAKPIVPPSCMPSSWRACSRGTREAAGKLTVLRVELRVSRVTLDLEPARREGLADFSESQIVLPQFVTHRASVSRDRRPSGRGGSHPFPPTVCPLRPRMECLGRAGLLLGRARPRRRGDVRWIRRCSSAGGPPPRGGSGGPWSCSGRRCGS